MGSQVGQFLFGSNFAEMVEQTKTLYRNSQNFMENRARPPTNIRERGEGQKREQETQRQPDDGQTSGLQEERGEEEIEPVSRLKGFKDAWRKICKDNVILSWLDGFIIPFEGEVIQTAIPKQPIPWSSTERRSILSSLKHLKVIGAISPCKPVEGQFISNIFIVPKSDGSDRLILNLKGLNSFVRTYHFKLEDRKLATSLMVKNCYMTTLDLKGAYFMIPIAQEHKKYLRFYFDSNLWEFNCMPFGLSVAPWVFTKLLRPVLTHLRSLGLMSVNYLDDFLLFGASIQKFEENVAITRETLESLGFLINYEKSSLTPRTMCKFLGFNFDSERLGFGLPSEKVSKIARFKEFKGVTIREFAKLCGVFVSICPAIPYGWVYTKRFEREKFLALRENKDNYDAYMIVSPKLQPDFQWWKDSLKYPFCKLNSFTFVLEIFSDASLSGWGAVCGEERSRGLWSADERKMSINFLELSAAFMGLRVFASNLRDCEILLRIDNTTAISYVNRMGGVQYPHLNAVTRRIWQWCEQRGIFIYASYISSQSNYEADFESRNGEENTEWELSQGVFNDITSKFGTPEIDLFASRNNKKCEKFVSWFRDPDAFLSLFSWRKYYFYAFPPFSLLPRVIKKIREDKATGIVVAPYWPSLYPNEELSLKNLTYKMVMLLALATAHRVQTLSLINVDNIESTNSGFQIKIPDRIKTSGR
ncbi:hypothetical protein NQ315_014082, partial [Exocentrus adspersus]